MELHLCSGIFVAAYMQRGRGPWAPTDRPAVQIGGPQHSRGKRESLRLTGFLLSPDTGMLQGHIYDAVCCRPLQGQDFA